jgi:hypothetical protein
MGQKTYSMALDLRTNFPNGSSFLYSMVSLPDKETSRVEHIQNSTRCLEKVVSLLLFKSHFF